MNITISISTEVVSKEPLYADIESFLSGKIAYGDLLAKFLDAWGDNQGEAKTQMDEVLSRVMSTRTVISNDSDQP